MKIFLQILITLSLIISITGAAVGQGQVYDVRASATEDPANNHATGQTFVYTWKITKRDGVSGPNIQRPVTVSIPLPGALFVVQSIQTSATGADAPLDCSASHDATVICNAPQIVNVHTIRITVRIVGMRAGCMGIAAYLLINSRYVSIDQFCFNATSSVSTPNLLWLPVVSTTD